MPTSISSIALANIKMRWTEPYITSGFNRIMAGFRAGIMHGLVPVAVAGSDPVLRLEVDAERGNSIARFRHPGLVYAPTYYNDSDVDLDLTDFAGTRVYIGLSITYNEGVASSGEFTGYTEAEYRAGGALPLFVCYVDVPGSGALSASDIHSAVAEYADDEEWLKLQAQNGALDRPAVHRSCIDAMATTALTVALSANAHGSGPAYSIAYGGGTDDAWIPVGVYPVEAGDRVAVSVFKETNAATATGVGARVVWSDGSAVLSTSELYFDEAAPSADSTSYHLAGVTATAPASSKWAIVYIGVADLSAGTVYMSGPRVVTSADHGSNRMAAPVQAASLGLLGRNASLSEARIYLDNSATPVLQVKAPAETQFSGDVQATGFVPTSMTGGVKYIGAGLATALDIQSRDSSWSVATDYLVHSPGVFETKQMFCRVPLPPGCTLTEIRLRSSEHAGDATASASISLYRVTMVAGVASSTFVGSDTVTGTGTPATLNTMSITTLSEAFDQDTDLIVAITSSGSVADARRFYSIEFDWSVQEVRS